MDSTLPAVVKVVIISVSVIGIMGNALVCHVIVRLKTMKTSINYIILNLAIVDAVSGFLSIYFVFGKDFQGYLSETPMLRQAYNNSVVLAEVLCKVQWCYWFSQTISPILLVAMAYERYRAIVHPFSRLDSKTMPKKLKGIVIGAWLAGLSKQIFDLCVVKYDVSRGVCLNNTTYHWFSIRTFLLVLALMRYVIPSIFISYFYFRVICSLRKQDNALGRQSEAERARRKAKKKVMWIIIAVTVVFYIFCGVPSFVYIFQAFDLLDLRSFGILLDLPELLLSLNSAFNPFVYFIFIQSFRNAFKKVLLSAFQSNSLSEFGGSHILNLKNRANAGEQTDNASQPTLLAFTSSTVRDY